MYAFLEKNPDFKLLKFFSENPLRELYVKEISRELKLSSGSVSVVCRELEKDGLLKSRRQGNILFYKADRNNFLIKEFAKIFLIKKLNSINFIESFLKEDQNILSLAIYGSFAEAGNNKQSDLDVLVITSSGNKFIKAAEELSKKLSIEIRQVIFSLHEWGQLSKKRDVFYLNVINNHLLLYGSNLVI